MGPPSKKRKIKQSATEEVVFDPSARFDYLTGFHKRKVQRTKHAQEAAARRARQDKIDDRKKLREERKADLERHVKEVNALLPSRPQVSDSESGGEAGESDGEWSGLTDGGPALVDHENEYVDEDKYTTVVVEEVDISRNGIVKSRGSDEEDEDGHQKLQKSTEPDRQKKPTSQKKVKDKDKKPKKKRKSFRYESPAERKLNRAKERAKKSKAAKVRRGD